MGRVEAGEFEEVVGAEATGTEAAKGDRAPRGDEL
jgi:hypothetical protein